MSKIAIVFVLITSLGQGSGEEFVIQMRELVRRWILVKQKVASVLFTFLADISRNSQETQMDPYNLAICFGPNLCPIPEGREHVQFNSTVNTLIKNFIIFSHEIFSKELLPALVPSLTPILPDLVWGGQLS